MDNEEKTIQDLLQEAQHALENLVYEQQEIIYALKVKLDISVSK